MLDRTAQRVWKSALGQLQFQVTGPNYQTWLLDTEGLRLEANTLVVGVRSAFAAEWLVARVRGLASRIVSKTLGRRMEVSFEICANGAKDGDESPLVGARSPAQAVISSPVPDQRLNPRYQFESFVVADSNRLAAAAACRAAEEPGRDYNPLVIHSRPGLGKTHLLQAVAQQVAQRQKSALYVTSEGFTNSFVNAITSGNTTEFRRRYRLPDVLLVDDIQFFGDKKGTQDEFFHTFNDLHSNGCQVVVAADNPPASIPGFQSRLSSRLQGGLVAGIQPPDFETRVAIVKMKAAQRGVELPDDVAHFLAERAPDNIRQLEGMLNSAVAYANMMRCAVTLDCAAKALPPSPPSSASDLEPEEFLKAVSSHSGIPLAALAGKSRTRPIVEARHIAMYLMRKDTTAPLKKIGQLLGSRDHSTVIYGVAKVSRLRKSDPALSSQLSEIRRRVNGS